MAAQKWRVRLGALAELDFANVIRWTTENFGTSQARIYQDTLLRAIGELSVGPNVRGSKARNDIVSGMRTLHVAQHGRRGRHLLLYRAVEGRIIEIGRILHDQMDPQRHWPSSRSESDE